MIGKSQIKTKTLLKVEKSGVKEFGVFLEIETSQGKYGRAYNTFNPKCSSYVKSIDEAKDRFLREFFNQFE